MRLLEEYLVQNGKVYEQIARDFHEILESQFVKMVEEIQSILMNGEMSDFYKVEAIIEVYEKHGISPGTCHDFG